MRLVYTPGTYIVSVWLLLENKQGIRGVLKQTHKLTKTCPHFGEKKLKNTERNHTSSGHIYFPYLSIYFAHKRNGMRELSKISNITHDIILC